MTILKVVTTVLITFIILAVLAVSNGTDDRNTLMGFGVIIATELLSIICIWG